VSRTVLCRMLGLMNEYLGKTRNDAVVFPCNSLEVLRQEAKSFGQDIRPTMKTEATSFSDESIIDFQWMTELFRTVGISGKKHCNYGILRNSLSRNLSLSQGSSLRENMPLIHHTILC
jgi:hypothetical protein